MLAAVTRALAGAGPPLCRCAYATSMPKLVVHAAPPAWPGMGWSRAGGSVRGVHMPAMAMRAPWPANPPPWHAPRHASTHVRHSPPPVLHRGFGSAWRGDDRGTRRAQGRRWSRAGSSAEPRKLLTRADAAEYACSGGQTRRTWLAVRPLRRRCRRCRSPARRSRRRTSASCTRSLWVRRAAAAELLVRCGPPVRQRVCTWVPRASLSRAVSLPRERCKRERTGSSQATHSRRACMAVPPLPASVCAHGVTRHGSCWR